MAQGLIYMVEGGELRRMKPSAPENEDRMQELVARYPELITDGDGDLLLVTREQPIADSEDGAGRWSLDHLFITKDAVPVLVELKRATDTRLRREVVGQILDYAANATAYWQAGRIAAAFAVTVAASGGDPENVLSQFLGEREPPAFWSQVDSNFRAGRIKLVIVADEIPRELARVIEFLNDQMRADVRGVELRWFEGDGNVVTLSPRVIGETERAAAAKEPSAPLEPLTTEQWLERHIAPLGPTAMTGAHAYMEIVRRLGGRTAVTKAQGSLYAEFTGDEGRPYYPFHLWSKGGPMGKSGLVSLSLMWLQSRPSLRDESSRRRLLDSLVAIVGPMTTTKLTGFPSYNITLLADPSLAARVEAWLSAAVSELRTADRA